MDHPDFERCTEWCIDRESLDTEFWRKSAILSWVICAIMLVITVIALSS